MTLNFSILSCIFMVNGGLHFFVPHRATKMSGPALIPCMNVLLLCLLFFYYDSVMYFQEQKAINIFTLI